jgi:F-type H+-transporting ATPase subunit gamma
VNSFVCKAVKLGLAAYNEAGKDARTTTFGEKGRAQLQRQFAKNYAVSVDENQKDPVNFTKISALAERVIAQEFDQGYMFFNRFNNSISYTTSRLPLPSFGNPTFVPLSQDDAEGTDAGPAYLAAYECEDDVREECMQNLYEFSMACMLYSGAIENATSEQSSRMTSMDNATKNSDEMVSTLTLKVNRARQAAITTELIEIISGASALDDM